MYGINIPIVTVKFLDFKIISLVLQSGEYLNNNLLQFSFRWNDLNRGRMVRIEASDRFKGRAHNVPIHQLAVSWLIASGGSSLKIFSSEI